VEESRIYDDIALRTDGDIYLGVVGPVRTGKSTFIKRFMESLVIPNIENVYIKERARDELPQSGSGRTIMTAEPKFVPEDAVEIKLPGGAVLSVRLIDCVGYMVEGAVGKLEDGMERMVTTPWFDHEVTLTEAAEFGTRKVITEHSTIGIVITTDGSITDIPRESYVVPEERVIRELQEIGKPFIVIVNTTNPNSKAAKDICDRISSEYGVTCLVKDCMTLDNDDIADIIKRVLYEFPVSGFGIFLPAWVDALDLEDPIRAGVVSNVREKTADMRKIGDVEKITAALADSEGVSRAYTGAIDLGTGMATAVIELPRTLFYSTLSAQSGFEVGDDGDLMMLMRDLQSVKHEYDKISAALSEVRARGYGIVMPGQEELALCEPEIVRHGGRYGVRLRASAPSIHMIRADIETEVSPIVGGEKESEELVKYMLQEFEEDPQKIWETNIFGKSVHELVSEGLNNKLSRMPEEAQDKLQNALQRIINEGGGGLICIIL